MKLVLATRNIGKVNELTSMLNTNRQHQYIQLLSLQDFPNVPEVIEDGETYEENAAKKATVIADYTGFRTLADDAGIEVEALGGAPGVHSKRWAGEDATDAIRIQKMLKTLHGKVNRKARFVAAIAIADPISDKSEDKHNQMKQPRSYITDRVQVVVGNCEGHITHTPAGNSGFGYDPIFVPNGYDKSFAELGDAIKNQISHRSEALRLALK
ncbi:RdgB/HAM1 family non-canonical purine NTP pyrophosphatase, partial [Candidatus Poribacteria bacterium]|nr:RdgB/HAM1 family non-canonical purine NTP pyrophosphatase [Candidatus Poribacteria bacterium]